MPKIGHGARCTLAGLQLSVADDLLGAGESSRRTLKEVQSFGARRNWSPGSSEWTEPVRRLAIHRRLLERVTDLEQG